MNTVAVRTSTRRFLTRRNLVIALVVIAGFPVSIAWALGIGLIESKWSEQSHDYSLDSYEMYAVANIIHTTPQALLADPSKYSTRLLSIQHIEARTLAIDSHRLGLEGSIQFVSYVTDQPAFQILLVDENSYVTPDCTSSTIGCPRSLGDRMQLNQVGATARYDTIQGRWLPLNRYPIPRLSRQPAYSYALWVAKAWVPGALGPR
jgi:hypothetical protein